MRSQNTYDEAGQYPPTQSTRELIEKKTSSSEERREKIIADMMENKGLVGNPCGKGVFTSF